MQKTLATRGRKEMDVGGRVGVGDPVQLAVDDFLQVSLQSVETCVPPDTQPAVLWEKEVRYGSGSSVRTQRRAEHVHGGSIDPCRDTASGRLAAMYHCGPASCRARAALAALAPRALVKSSPGGDTHSWLAAIAGCSSTPSVRAPSQG